jgi:trimeric autotransporter adhesin
MNPLIQLKNATSVFLIALACFGLSPMARAVDPPPDGGYPNQNTAEGDSALFSLTTGTQNTATGFQALFNTTTASFNTATGVGALLSNTTGGQNTAIGVNALRSNTTGVSSTAIGFRTLYNYNRTTTIGNTAIGANALFSDTTGVANTATGSSALFYNTTGYNITANGNAALYFNTTGVRNTAIGVNALLSNTTGSSNTAIGDMALGGNVGPVSTGNFNTATAANALQFTTTGSNNTANGYSALQFNTTGSFNIALGNLAGNNLTTGSNNIDIGNVGVAAESATIRIGTAGTQTATFIAGIYGATVTNGVQVMVGSDGKLGTMLSSARFKEAIKPMDKASEAILGLKPVTFRYRQELDPAGIRQFGLVAEEVENVNPDLVVRDKEGKPYSVRYDQVNAMLLNEFLKEHRKVEELEATVSRQQKQIDALARGLEKVNNQLELSKPEPRTVANNR